MDDQIVVRPMADADRLPVARMTEEMSESFTSYGRAAILADAVGHEAVVAAVGSLIVGFVVWLETYAEFEILWLGVRPAFRRRGIGRRLIGEVERRIDCQRVIVLKTASPDHLPSSEGLNATEFRGTKAFFQRLGYVPAALIPEYWDRANGAVLFTKSMSRSEADHEPEQEAT